MAEKLLEIGIEALMPDPSQPRKTFNADAIDRLAKSVGKLGIQQPIRVIWDDERQCWLILTGESRFRAAKKAGLTHVPCLVVSGELSEADRLADRLTENAMRDDLPAMEEAAGIARLKAIKGCNSKALVDEYGFTGAAITRMEALLRLPPDIQMMVGSGPGQVPPSAAYEISRLDDRHAQLELAHAVADKRISRDNVAEQVRNRVGRKPGRPKPSRLMFKLDGGVAATVSVAKPPTATILNGLAEQLKREARKIEAAALAVSVKAS